MTEKYIEYNKMLEYWEQLHRATYIYVPVNNDPIDKLLAEFINKCDYKKKAKCLFVREEPGVYAFFDKRVIMLSEMGKLNIRVGGGYMSVD